MSPRPMRTYRPADVRCRICGKPLDLARDVITHDSEGFRHRMPCAPEGSRCEATVERYVEGTGDHDASEAEYRPETCGRVAKGIVRVGNRDVPSCDVHARALRRLADLA